MKWRRRRQSQAARETSAVAPRFRDVDAWGLTHVGNLRETNQDHFLMGSVLRGIAVERTSLERDALESLGRERLASLGIVADGVGSSPGGEPAARAAVEALVREVSAGFFRAKQAESEDPAAYSRLLHEAALGCHRSLLRRSEQEPALGPFATTLTLFLGLWPHAYLLQVGDSRCYVYQGGSLTQVTRDQTWAQDLVDSGVLAQTKADESQWANVLSSAVGAGEATPVVTRIVRDWGAVVLLCSDGLTRHVSDERIQERIESMESARQLCEVLLQDALDDGGSDNVTIVVGRTLKPAGDS